MLVKNAVHRTDTGEAFDASGNLYVADYYYNTISKVTPAGVISTFVSSTQGLANPIGLAFDTDGNLYVANTDGGTITMVTPAGTVCTVVVGLTATETGLCFDKSGNLFVSTLDNKIYKIDLASVPPQLSASVGNMESTVIGSAFGTPLQAQLTDASGKPLPDQLVTFTVNNAANGAGATFGGSTVVTVVTNAEGMAIAPALTADAVAGSFTVTASAENVSTDFNLTNLPATPQVTIAPVRIIYGTPLANDELSGSATWTAGGQSVSVPGTFTFGSAAGTVLNAGDGQSEEVTFIPTDTNDYSIVTATVTVNVAQATPLVSVNPVSITYGTALANGQLSGTATWIVAGQSVSVAGTFSYPSAAGAVLSAGSDQSEAVTFTPRDATDYTTDSTTVIVNVANIAPPTLTTFVTEGLNSPTGMAFDSRGNLYVANYTANTISEISPAGVVTTFVNSNQGLKNPIAVAFDANGNLYVANTTSISKVTPGGVVSTFVNFNYGADPWGLAIDASGNLYVSFYGDGFIAKVTPEGAQSIFVNSNQGLDLPRGLAVDASGNLYVANGFGNTISKVTPAGVVSTFVSSTEGLNGPLGLAFDTSGNLYIANAGLDRIGMIAKVTPAGILSTFLGPYSLVDEYPFDLCFDSQGNLFVSTEYDTIDEVTFNVAPVTPRVSVNPVNITYGTALTNSQLSGTATATANGQTVTVAGTFTYTSAAGTVLDAGNGQSEAVTFTPSDSTDYTTATTTVVVNVAQATPQLSVNPVNLTYGTALADGQLSGTATWIVAGQSVSVAGTFSYTSAAGTVLPAGNGQSEAVTFTPADTTDYATASTTVIVNVAQPPPELSALFGNNESTIVGTAFGTLLEAQVTDTSGNPLPGYSVTFTVHNASNGAGATFGGNTVVTVTTNKEGLAIAPVLTADTVAGSFSVTASANGASTTFLLTNMSGAPAKVTVVGGNGQSAPINSIFGTLLQVEVTDAYGNPVTGAAVTFSAPQSGASGNFNAVTTLPTNALGIATAPALTANDVAGSFNVTASVSGVGTPAEFDLTNTGPAGSPFSAAAITLPVPDGSDAFGSSVALSANDVLVGAYLTNGFSGTAYLYNTAGTLLQTFNDPGNTTAGDEFGYSVALSGNDILVGAPVGEAAYLYNTAGTLLHTFDSPGTKLGLFGNSVALSGNDVLVGAYLTNSGNGAAYLYNTSGTLLRTFNDPGKPGDNDSFGYSVALSGYHVLVGASLANGVKGAAYLYDTSGTLLHSFNDPGNNYNDFFGSSVALSGNDVLVGAQDTKGGAAYLYNTSGTLVQSFNDPGNDDGDEFGYSVALSGNDVLVGAFGANAEKGVAYLYSTSGTLLQTFNDPGNTAYDGFGDSVALSGNDLLVGAFTQANRYSGAAYLYTAETGEISALFGNNQSTIVGTAFGTLHEAQVTDASGNPVPGDAVTFTVIDASNGAGASFGGSMVVTATTNAEGLAIAPALTADTVAGPFSVVGTVSGVSTTFLLSNVSGPPATIVVAGGSGQQTRIDSAYYTLLQVEVTDSYGNPVADVPVTFTAPSSGPSGTFNAVATVPTNALGIATAPAFTANDITGTFQVTATVSGLASAADFTLSSVSLTNWWITVVGPQLSELHREFLPYKAVRQVASFVPSNDLESLDVAKGKVAINVLAFVDMEAEVKRLGGQVSAVRYLPVAAGLPGVEVQALLPIGKLPALGRLADVVSVTPNYRVGPAGSTEPTITTNPTNQTVDAGGQATFTAAATGVPTPTVQWQVSRDGGKIFTNIPDATSMTLTFIAVARQTGDEYRAVFSNDLGEVSTTAAALTVQRAAIRRRLR